MIKRELDRLTVLLLLFLLPSMVIVGCGKKEDARKKPVQSKPQAPSQEPRATSPEPQAAKETPKEPVLSPDKYGRNDPFDPVFAADSDKEGMLVLEGIVWDEENPKAIINNKIIGIGDRIRGNTVVNIKQDRAVLNDGTMDFELRSGQKK